MVETKRCPRCEIVKPTDAFYRHKGMPDGRQTYCRDCFRPMARAYQVANPELYRAASRKHYYTKLSVRHGVTRDFLEALFTRQKGRCAICKQEETTRSRATKGGPGETIRRLSVDHDHVTGKVRGYLCSACNQALGGFRDDPVLLRRAARYVSQFK